MLSGLVGTMPIMANGYYILPGKLDISTDAGIATKRSHALPLVPIWTQTFALWPLESVKASLSEHGDVACSAKGCESIFVSRQERGDRKQALQERSTANFAIHADIGEAIVRYTLFDRRKDEAILVARILLMILFVLFGWGKLTGFAGTVTLMVAEGAPVPTVSAIIAVVMEFFVGVAILLGFYTRPLALLLALYTLAAAVIGHHYWTMLDGERIANMIDFYKNVSIMGALLLLCVTGPGKYSIDGR
jgi:putative oxidoreductase